MLWFISACVCVSATLFILPVANDAILVARRRSRWQSSQATVIGQGSRLLNTGPANGYWPATVRYSIACYTDLQGKERTLKVAEKPNGTEASILYDSRYPTRACVDAAFSPGILLFFVAIAAITGLVLYLVPMP